MKYPKMVKIVIFALFVVFINGLVVAFFSSCATQSDGLSKLEIKRLNDKPVVSHESLKGMHKSEVVELFGRPASSHEFVVNEGEALPEFESHLYDLLGKEKTKRVLRLMWNLEDIRRVLWFVKKNEKWTVHSGLTWDTSRIDM